MTRKEMRLVGISDTIEKIAVQRKDRFEWTQEHMTFADFAELVKNEFPELLKEGETNKELANRLYNVGADEPETYVFK